MNKIAIYIDSEYNGSGGSQYTKALLNALIGLSTNNISLTVIYTRKGWDNHLNKIKNIKSIFFRNNSYLKRIYQILISLGCLLIAKIIAHKYDPIVEYIENNNYDLVIFPSADTLACLVNSKVVGTIHDLMHRYEKRFKESGSIFKYHYRDNYYQHLLLSSAAVLVDSNLGKRQVIESYSKIRANIFILPYIAPDYIYSKIIDNSYTSIISDCCRKFLFYPAVFWPHKNHINLIKAILILKERGQLIDLYLGGKKQYEYKKLHKFVNENGLEEQVKFLGYISYADMIYLYKNAFAMVMPTYFGPTNIPPIEAVMLNCPLIISNNYGMNEQCEDAAIYFNPNSSLEIAIAIELLLTNNELRNNLLRNGIKIKEKFSQKRFETDIDNILQKLI